MPPSVISKSPRRLVESWLPGKNLVLRNHSESEAENPGKENRSRMENRVDREGNRHSSDFICSDQLLPKKSKLENTQTSQKLQKRYSKRDTPWTRKELFHGLFWCGPV